MQISNFRSTACVLVIFMLLISAACEDAAAPPIDPDRFARLYTDLVFQSLDSTQVDSATYIRAFLDSHNVSPQLFRQSLAFYNEHPKLWLEVITKAKDELEKNAPDNAKPPIRISPRLKK